MAEVDKGNYALGQQKLAEAFDIKPLIPRLGMGARSAFWMFLAHGISWPISKKVFIFRTQSRSFDVRLELERLLLGCFGNDTVDSTCFKTLKVRFRVGSNIHPNQQSSIEG